MFSKLNLKQFKMKQKLLLAVFLFVSIYNSYGQGNDPSSKINIIENKGQWNSDINFMAKIGGGNVWFQNNSFTFEFFNQEDIHNLHQATHGKYTPSASDKIRQHAYSLNFLNANADVKMKSSDKVDFYHNYYIGNDKSKWATKVKLFAEVEYGNLYNGVDVRVGTSDDGYFKYDFIVHAGADASQIKWSYNGIDPQLKNNKIILNSNAGEIIESLPEVYQWINGEKKLVECKILLNNKIVSLNFPNGYNTNYDLIIDPTLIFSTYTGSTADNWGYTATNDSLGNAYGGGVVFSAGFPVSVGAFDNTFSGGGSVTDIGLIKYSPNGVSRLFATYLGGTGAESPHSLIVDSQDNIIIYGTTSSANFPTSAGCYDNTFNGGTSVTMDGYISYSAGVDIFVTKLSSTGASLLGSTFFGGTANEGFNNVATLYYNYGDEARGEVIVDDNDNIIVASCTQSSNFPTTVGALSVALQGTQDGVAFQLSPNCATLAWSTYLGGLSTDAAYGVKKNPINGNVYVCGGTRSANFPTLPGTIKPLAGGGTADGFVIALNASNASIVTGSYLGTAGYDQAYAIQIDSDGDVYLMGQSTGSYPVVGTVYSNPGSSQFIHKINPALTSTLWSTVIGSGSSATINISPVAFLVDYCKNIYISGWGGSINAGYGNGSTTGMPITAGAYDVTTDGSDFYCMVLERNAASLLYGTFFGGSGAEHVDGGTSRFDNNGTIYQAVCAGCGGSSAFPTTPGVWSNTNASSNCNLGLFKMEFNYNGIIADATAAPNIIACDPPYDVNFVGSIAGVQHYWDFGDGSPTSNIMSPIHTYTGLGIFTVMYVAIDSSTCNIADTVYLTVEILAAEVFSTTLNIPPYDPCVDSVFTVNLEFTGTGADSLYWNMGDGTTFIDDTLINYSYITEGTYVITLTAWDFTCNNTATITDTISFNSSFLTAVATAAPNIIACDPPYDVNFTGATTPQHYWDFGDGSPIDTSGSPIHTYTGLGTFTVMYVAIDSSTCNIADTVYLSVQILAAEIFSTTLNIPPYDPCVDSVFNVNLEFTGTGADSLYWSMGDGTTFINDTMINYSYLTDGTYIISLTAWDFACGNTATITDTIFFNSSILTATAEASPNIIQCDPPFIANFTGSSTPQHYWNFGDGSLDSTSILQNPDHTYTTIGNYTVMYVAIDSSTCNITDTVFLTVQVLEQEIFSATFSSIPPQPCKDTVYVNINFTGTGADSLIWNMGDGITFINDTTVSYFYTTPGTYTVSLTAFDNTCNNVGTINQTITVDEQALQGATLIPNIFTPNNDGENDRFQLLFSAAPGVNPAQYYEEYSMQIFNRWGKKIFESNSDSWDGRIDGKDANDGVYFYLITYKEICVDEETTVAKGHVTILR